jgi:hypothetical protein
MLAFSRQNRGSESSLRNVWPLMRVSQHFLQGYWIFPHRNANYHVQAKNAHTLPDTRLQE